MAWNSSEELRIRAIETALNNIQNALNNLATKQLVKSILYPLQNDLNTLEAALDQIEADQLNHGAMIGLEDDDHTQYLNETRHDALTADNPHSVTFTQVVTADAETDISAAEAETLTDGSDADLLHTHTHANLTDVHNLTTDIDHNSITNTHDLTTDIDHNSITNTHNLTTDIDHGSISGLGDDDHTQYTLRSDWNQNGFTDKSLSTLSFTDATRTFSIQPTGADFPYFYNGNIYTTTGDELVVTDVEGMHYIYYKEDSLDEVVNPTQTEIAALWLTKTLVSVVYWDSSEAEAIYVGEERHGAAMSPSTHSYLHHNEGLRYRTGLGLNTISADENGSNNAHAQFGVDAGAVQDEDIYDPISAVLSTTGLPIYYMTGADANWNRHVNAGFSVRTFDGTSSARLAYNQYTGGAWQLKEATNTKYILCHIIATTEKDNPIIAVMGQAEYNNSPQAQAGAETEIETILFSSMPLPELRPIASVIFQTSDSYTNDVNARIVSTGDGDDYQDFRNQLISRTVVSTTDHGSLTGLGDDDHTQYILADGTRAFSGNIQFGQQVQPPTPTVSTPTGTTQTIDWNDGVCQTLDLESAAGDVTLTLSNGIAGGSYIIKVIQDSASAVNAIWPAEVLWAGGTAPTISTGADAIDIISLYFDGTNYFGSFVQDFS